MIRSKDHKYSWRLALVLYARTHGNRAAARVFATTPKTVRRWRERFEAQGRSGLRELSRAPRRCPHKTSKAQEAKIIAARRQAPCFGPRRLRLMFGLKASVGAIARVLREHGLVRRRRKKHQKKNDLRAIKARYRPLERLQADTKPLYDIPAYWPQMMEHRLPRQQYSVRDVKSGAIWLDYADELSTTYATWGVQRLLEHLAHCDQDLRGIVLSTDNGSEYGGSERYERQRGFHYKVQQRGVTHRFLPPATPNAHGDVESMHASIEHELFDLERFNSREDFFKKVRAYQLWWNFARPNFSKGGKTPAQILREEGVDPRILILPPLDLDHHLRNRNYSGRVGSHVPVLPGHQ